MNDLPDGRGVTWLGRRLFCGVRKSATAMVLALAALGFGGGSMPPVAAENLLNVSRDPTRELYDEIASTGMSGKDWQSRLPHNSSPHTSTIGFLVRHGKPKGTKDRRDLVQVSLEVITHNPKTSGGAGWTYLAAWAWAKKNGKDPQAFVTAICSHVPVLDKGARDSATTFTRRGIGDVLHA